MDEVKLLCSRIDDILESFKGDTVASIGFLNESEASVAASYVKNKGVYYNFQGGYEGALRVMLLISSDEYYLYDDSILPFEALHIRARKGTKLTHRDYLGSLMGLGIKRHCIGDIVTLDESSAVVFVLKKMSSYIINELKKVGREGISVSYFSGSLNSLCNKHEKINVIVTSMRIDNIVSAFAKVSRSESIGLINSDKVYINYSIPLKISNLVHFGDTISIRGYGKFKILEQITTIKRDRLVLSVLHYI